MIVRCREDAIRSTYVPAVNSGYHRSAFIQLLFQHLIALPLARKGGSVEFLFVGNACSRLRLDRFAVIRDIGLGANGRNAYVIVGERLQTVDGVRIRGDIGCDPLCLRIITRFILNMPSDLTAVSGPSYLNRVRGSSTLHIVEIRRLQAIRHLLHQQIINVNTVITATTVGQIER